MKIEKFISIVIYIHDSAQYVQKFLDNVVSSIDNKFSHVELVCVDDACVDDSLGIIEKWTKNQGGHIVTNIVHMSCYQGLESAMNAGRDLAIGDFVYEFDDCLCDYDLDKIDKMYELVTNGFDIVSAGVSVSSGMSKLYYKLYNSTSRSNAKIGPETCRVLSRRAINRIKNMSQYIPYRKAVYSNCGLKCTTITYDSTDMQLRKKLRKSTKERFGLAMDSFVFFTSFLERLSLALCIVFIVTTIAMGIYVLCNQFFQIRPVEGWMSTMLFLSVGFGGLFLLLTIVLKYLSTLLNLIFKQSHYAVENVDKVNVNE